MSQREDLRNHSLFKILSGVVLFFFTWTFGGLFDVAYAVNSAAERQAINPSGQRPIESAKDTKPATQRPDEKLQKTLEEISNIIKDPSKDINQKKGFLRAKASEIRALDAGIRAEFKKTEMSLRAKKLPSVVLQRHQKFVRSYEKNLRELTTNLSLIDRARTKPQFESALKKALAHLDKVRPPKRHKPLDPNKLPHRTAEPVWKKPRLTKVEATLREDSLREEFERDLRAERKPILVASAGSLAGILSSAVVQATPPSEEDLAETIEVRFTPEIRAKAEELGKSPVKIYEFVRNNIEYVPTYGSIQGADMCLKTMQCNDMDTASLLIALLRASNIPARYAYGTIELPIEKVMNWAGGFTDANAALELIASGGTPVAGVVEGGKITSVQMEHMWVEAYVPYGNYRGSMRDGSIKTWIPLDGSFKQYNYQKGMDLYTPMAINGESYINDFITDASPSPIPAELQELFPSYIRSPYQFYSKRLLNYLDANFPEASIEDVIGADTVRGAKKIIIKEYPYLLGSLPYRALVAGMKTSGLNEAYRYSLSFSVEDPYNMVTPLNYTIALPEAAGKRITLSYVPATQADETLVAQYGGLLKVPPYLLNVKPVLKVNGMPVAYGGPIGLGYEETFTMVFIGPNKEPNIVQNRITAGDYRGIAIQYYKTPAESVGDKMEALTKNIGSTDLDDLLGQMLYNIGLSYLHHLCFEEELYEKNFQMAVLKEPSEAMAISHAVTEWLWDVPYRVTEGGIGIDVDRNIYMPVSLDGDRARVKDFMTVSGIAGSAWEHMVLESFFDIPSVSAARLLKMAHEQGMPIYTITKDNMGEMLSQLQVSEEVIADIINSVNAGKKVIIPKANIQYNDWNGTGYIILDPNTGAGAYMIGGGLNGAYPSMALLDKLSNRDIDALYKRICSQKRGIILNAARSKLGAPYIWGGGRTDNPRGFDCSGLVSWCYKQAGFNSVVGHHITAQSQFDATIHTDYPFYIDLVFFRGSQDTNHDCYKNEKDNVSHVGLLLQYDWMIHASYTYGEVVIAKVSDLQFINEKRAISVSDNCLHDSRVDINNGKCPAIDGCVYQYDSTGRRIEFLEDMKYAPEFDTCQSE